MLALVLSMAFATDPPKAAAKPAADSPPGTEHSVAKQYLVLLKLGSQTTFLGDPAAAISRLGSAAWVAASEQPGGLQGLQVGLLPILAQGDPKAPNRVLLSLEVARMPGDKASHDAAATSICAELDRLLQDMASADHKNALSRREALEADVQRLRVQEDRLTAALDPANRALTPETCEARIAEKAREREAAERAFAAAQARLKSLAEHRARQAAGNLPKVDALAMRIIELKGELQALDARGLGPGNPERQRLEIILRNFQEAAESQAKGAADLPSKLEEALTAARLEAAQLSRRYAKDHQRTREAEEKVKLLEARSAQDAVSPAAAADFAKLALEAQMQEAEAALALKQSATEKDLERLQRQIEALRQRQDVRRRRAALEDEAVRTMRVEPPDVGVRILRINAAP